jgi:hypothetical protein
MGTKENALRKKKEIRDYLRLWVDNYKSSEEIAPSAMMQLENEEWEINALENAPEEADEIIIPGLYGKITRDIETVKNTYPMIPAFRSDQIAPQLSSSTSGSAVMYSFVARVGMLGTEDASSYADTFTNQYQEIQKKQERPTVVRGLLGKLRTPEIIERFDLASNAYHEFEIDPRKWRAAASEIRNFLYGFRGDLKVLATKNPKGNDQKWEVLVRKLSPYREGDVGYQTLLDQGKEHTALLKELGDIVHWREKRVYLLKNIWVRLLDYVYIVMGLLPISEFS